MDFYDFLILSKYFVNFHYINLSLFKTPQTGELASKYGHFWLQENQDGDGQSSNWRLQKSRRQTNEDITDAASIIHTVSDLE